MEAKVEDAKSLQFLLWLASIAFFMQTLDSTIVNTALPSMARTLGESPLRMQSVVIAYSLTMAMLIPASGWLADRFGTRRVFFGAIFLFSVGSALCAYSQTLTQLVFSRIVQGAGGAMLLPVGRLAVLRAFPKERFLQAMGFVATFGLVGPLIGPTLGGWLVEIASWHWVFLINIPVGIIGCLATLRFMPDAKIVDIAPFDLTGYLLLAFGMMAISFALDGVAELGFKHATVLVLAVFGLVSICAYWLHATRQTYPIFSLRLFKVHTFSVGLIGNLFARLGSGSIPFLIPLLLQVSLGYTPAEAGMMMLPVAIAGIVAKRLSTALITRVGYRKVLIVNTLLVGLAIASFGLISSGEPTWLRVIQFAIFGMLNSLQFTLMNTVTLKDLDGGLASSGNSLLSMVMMLSMSLGVAVAGMLLATFTEVFSHITTHNALTAFHATFFSVGLVTAASAFIFWQLSPEVKSEGKAETTLNVQA